MRATLTSEMLSGASARGVFRLDDLQVRHRGAGYLSSPRARADCPTRLADTTRAAYAVHGRGRLPLIPLSCNWSSAPALRRLRSRARVHYDEIADGLRDIAVVTLTWLPSKVQGGVGVQRASIPLCLRNLIDRVCSKFSRFLLRSVQPVARCQWCSHGTAGDYADCRSDPHVSGDGDRRARHPPIPQWFALELCSKLQGSDSCPGSVRGLGVSTTVVMRRPPGAFAHRDRSAPIATSGTLPQLPRAASRPPAVPSQA